MAGKSNMLLFIVVAIVAVVVVCAAAIYFLNKDSDDKDGDNGSEVTTYWLYVDYGANETTTVTNGWMSGEGSNAYEGVCAALEGKGIPYNITSGGGMDGLIVEINGVEPDWNATGESWSQFIWTGDTDSTISDGWEAMGTGITGVTTSQNIFYFGVTTFDPDTYEPDLDPNAKSGWKNGGPFA
ncbi:MAG: hypothetical protein FWH45_00245 [Methanomassiliicoccaceae archaeon]|nr:hypothetical protein [Methanomassiliicoccaceae archaeon]MCL2145605.1 hypothetical protein [Methanomassiliicoccaceae archaeon]